MDTTPPTITAPEVELPPAVDGPDVITAIRQYGRRVEYTLFAHQSTFTLGSSPTCSMYVPRRYVSALHGVLERNGPRLRLQDPSSRTGTFFRGHRETSFEIVPGDTFILGTTTLLAVNEYMRIQRPVMIELLGYDCEADTDDVLLASVQDGPYAGRRSGRFGVGCRSRFARSWSTFIFAPPTGSVSNYRIRLCLKAPICRKIPISESSAAPCDA